MSPAVKPLVVVAAGGMSLWTAPYGGTWTRVQPRIKRIAEARACRNNWPGQRLVRGIFFDMNVYIVRAPTYCERGE